MVRDSRGGSNRKGINEGFFKYWSPDMAYVLGFIYADGAIIDAEISSRTQYLSLTITDKELLEKIRDTLSSKNRLYVRKARLERFNNGCYLCKKAYTLRIGNKVIYRDLIDLGLTPKKSLRITFPKNLPNQYFCHFLRGYFDGDGCVNLHANKAQTSKNIQIIFTSGCKCFLEEISHQLCKLRKTTPKTVYINSNAFRLKYAQRESLNILEYIYQNLSSNLYLERKFRIYQRFLQDQNARTAD